METPGLQPGAGGSLEPVPDERSARRARVAAAYAEDPVMRHVATRLRISTKTVHEDLVALGVERLPSGQRPTRCELDRETRQQLVVGMYVLFDMTAQVIADALKVAKGTVQNDLKAMGVESRVGAPPAKYPPPAPRECAYKECDVVFTPPKPSGWEQRFCSRQCWGLQRINVDYDYPPFFAPLTEVCSPKSRQMHGGRKASRNPPAIGGRPRGRQRVELTDEQVSRIETFAARGWGRRAIANELGIGPDVVRRVLAELGPPS
jgi:hypothetical protein